ncbi:MAG: dipicolinate synthase subunit DpsA [Clostridia bacterium]|nr:dipicolinate synthase subunit DpsA [Clostridia bacterium]
MTDRFLIIGGGIRLVKACEAFLSRGYEASVYNGVIPLKTAIDKADIILLGLPASKDDINIELDDGKKIPLRDIAALSGGRKIVLGGRFSEKVKALFDIYSVRWADYAATEEFEILNAVPTAEGAIQIAMEEFPFTLHKSRSVVTGFGKVAKALAFRLKALGSECSVVARNPSARAEAESFGFKAIDFSNLPYEAKNCHILFNTVPAMVIGKNVLGQLKPSQGIIDLASKPGGVDLDSAKTYGVNVVWALSLPGKVAPLTAGEIICQTACNIACDLRMQN